MPYLLLDTQDVDALDDCETITELAITQAWIDKHTFDEITSLSQALKSVTHLDLSSIRLLKLNSSKVCALAMTFPEITELVLNKEDSLSASPAIKQIILGFKFLNKSSFNEPQDSSSKPAFNYFSPTAWGAHFWSVITVKSPKHHHDTTRDLFDITNVNSGHNNILSDWNRLDAGLVQINGHPIQTIITPNKDGVFFNTLEELKTFFKDHLLYKLNNNQKDAALDYIMNVLHQGGLQNPLTAAIYHHCNNKNSTLQPVDARNKVNGVPGQYRSSSFNATETGFNVSESLTQNRLAYNINAGEKAGEFLLPDDGYDFVFKAESKLNVSWAPDSSNPTITIDTIGTTFGSAVAQSIFDERWLFQTWIDNAWYYAGYNSIDDATDNDNQSPNKSS